MLTLKEGDQVDVDFLIAVGAIEPKAEAADSTVAEPDPNGGASG